MYLDVINDFKRRQSLSKLRLSAHNLEIEAGRFGKHRIPRSERYCKYCLSKGKHVLGDELHFVMICPQFQKKRENLEDNVAKLYPNIKYLSVSNKFTWLLSQEDKDCLNWTATFLSKCFKQKSESQS